jgi:hypothetical protein
MARSVGRFILAADAVTPAGMNIDISAAVAEADVAKFSQQELGDGMDRYPYANVGFVLGETFVERCGGLADIVMESLLGSLPRMLKPIPLLLSVPETLNGHEINRWIEQYDASLGIATVEVVQMSGPALVGKMNQLLEKHDAIMCIAVDSLYDLREQLVNQAKVMTGNNPWGIIPSEGAAGLVVCRKNVVDTLKLEPLAQFGYLAVNDNPLNARNMYHLVQQASTQIDSFGEVYTDMTNLRSHTEDYGFALGAKAEQFINPQQPKRINSLWGTMGSCSSIALIAYATQKHHFQHSISLMMFGVDKGVGLMQLLKEI